MRTVNKFHETDRFILPGVAIRQIDYSAYVAWDGARQSRTEQQGHLNLDLLVTKRRNKQAANRLFSKVLKGQENLRGNSSRTSSRAIQLPLVRSFPQSSIERVNPVSFVFGSDQL